MGAVVRTMEDYERVMTLYREEVPAQVIARTMGMGINTVRHMIDGSWWVLIPPEDRTGYRDVRPALADLTELYAGRRYDDREDCFRQIGHIAKSVVQVMRCRDVA